jgi:hypothetical protein
MTELTIATETGNRRRIRIFINDDPYFATDPSMTGQELLAMAGLPADNQIFLDVPGHREDVPVDASTPFKLRPGMKFYDVPVGTFG